MIAALREWLRAYNLRKLEAEVHYYAVTYQMAKSRYENAAIAEKNRKEE